MRRRLSLAIVGVVAGALAVTGLGSLLLAAHALRTDSRNQALTQATAIADQLEEAGRPAVLSLVRRTAGLEGAAVVVVGPAGGIRGDSLPSGLTPADIQPQQLLAGRTVSGVKGSLAYAASPATLSASQLQGATGLGRRAGAAISGLTAAVVVTRKVAGVPGGGAYFAFTALATLAVAALVADRLGVRIARPLAQVERTASRVAAGDLEGRVEVQEGDYPEIASLATSINTMTDSLERSRRHERQFLMSVSHDLRTPLTSIRGWAEAIADGAADGARAAQVIGAESGRLERLVQDLLDLAKLEARTFSLRLSPTQVGPVVAAAADSLRPAAREAGLELEVLVEPVPPADVDPDRLAQVVGNLVDNAYKYAASSIVVRVAPAGRDVVVSVTDDGPGIAPGDAPRVFERLYQTGRSPARQGGSGLGLAIVKELTEAMGGRVRVDSPCLDGAGTRLSVTLPGARSGPIGS